MFEVPILSRLPEPAAKIHTLYSECNRQIVSDRSIARIAMDRIAAGSSEIENDDERASASASKKKESGMLTTIPDVRKKSFSLKLGL